MKALNHKLPVISTGMKFFQFSPDFQFFQGQKFIRVNPVLKCGVQGNRIFFSVRVFAGEFDPRVTTHVLLPIDVNKHFSNYF